MSEFAIQFLNSEDQPITQETVAEVVEGIRKDRISDAWLGLDEYGEEEFLSVDLRDGWAAICFNTYEGETTPICICPSILRMRIQNPMRIRPWILEDRRRLGNETRWTT